MNRTRSRILLVSAAALALVFVLYAPVVGASTGAGARTMMGMPMPSPSSSMMGTPTPSPSPTSGDGTWCAGGFWAGSGSWGGTGMWGTGFGGAWLRRHPAAFDAWLAMRADHRTELRAWFDKYRGDLTSTEAQQALRVQWQDHWNDMKAFYQQYAGDAAWVCPSLTMWGGMMGGGGMMAGGVMWGMGHGAGWLTRHPAGFAAWQTLRARQMSRVNDWWTRYRSHPFSMAARRALAAMHARHKAQDLAFMSAHNVTAGATWSYQGWMGLGGSWGGFGW